MRRELWQTITELADGLLPATGEPAVRAVGVRLDLPMEIELRGVGADRRVLADLPGWRWRTEFDQQPGRLRVRLEEEAP